ncbi:class I SAM-dependent DNA methyltransferase [Dehalobacterium formicoaceticum]|uniref:Class I SAM-dependent methyltransferase n=1 Tax=Dehalobacterium formicoaceticum TaxID=51515 RepID=A0ABT1Y288_9FIRM|nr:class I SAM-dependent methyltransferase [Dehalobacterium formicoaceticum]MCR6544984.1 class I SAM-dependent methyltransferase [Dehalobacterium formicoaceticum]
MIYQSMAAVYDRLMGHVNYQDWVRGLEHQWQKLNIVPHQVLDVGCGTGNLLLPLVQGGYQVIGIDNSPEMLSVCQDRLFEKNLSSLLLEMDIEEIQLPKPVDSAICLCDTLNYLTDESALERGLKNIYHVLKPGGSFIFDLRTPHYYEDILADAEWMQKEEGLYLFWENDFSQNPLMNMELTFFIEEKNGLFRKYVEEHQQRCYPMEMMKELMEKMGFKLEAVVSNLWDRPLNLEQDERMYFICLKA